MKNSLFSLTVLLISAYTYTSASQLPHNKATWIKQVQAQTTQVAHAFKLKKHDKKIAKIKNKVQEIEHIEALQKALADREIILKKEINVYLIANDVMVPDELLKRFKFILTAQNALKNILIKNRNSEIQAEIDADSDAIDALSISLFGE